MRFPILLTTMALSATFGVASDDRTAEHPWIRLVADYRAASAGGDLETLARLQAEDARIWFEEREGPGRKLNVAGKGPWGDWDRFWNARSETLGVELLDDGVRITNLETNDWQRLVEREPAPYTIHYLVDGSGRISGKLIEAIPGSERKPDRLGEFKIWAGQTHPGLVERLMPEGKIDPALWNARLWKKHLLEWRAEAGLAAAP